MGLTFGKTVEAKEAAKLLFVTAAQTMKGSLDAQSVHLMDLARAYGVLSHAISAIPLLDDEEDYDVDDEEDDDDDDDRRDISHGL